VPQQVAKCLRYSLPDPKFDLLSATPNKQQQQQQQWRQQRCNERLNATGKYYLTLNFNWRSSSSSRRGGNNGA